MRHLLLFDVDGVLIHPLGYKYALRDTVNAFATQQGYTPVDLTLAEIADFEACGLTNEWDSAAVCAALLVVESAAGRQARPDFVAFAHQIAAHNPNHMTPALAALDLLKATTSADLHPQLGTLLTDVFSLDTPTTRLQQGFTLGHEHFVTTYQQAAPHTSPSYLLDYDTPLLDAPSKAALQQWRGEERGVVIYTARPSLPPMGDTLGYAPEGDFAAELLGLGVPLIAAGRMEWLARQHGRHAADYIKPSPVQALAAMGAAASGDELTALQAAARFYEQGQLEAPLASLDGAHITVFEDSVGGILATRGAVERLRGAGLDLTMQAVGVAPEASKQAALARIADHVVADVNAGLRLVIG